MNIAKQIIDKQLIKILEENQNAFSTSDDFERKKSKSFVLLAVSSYLEIDIAESVELLTEGGGDGGFDAAYIIEGQDSQLNVVLFQSKYVRDLEKDSNFPANSIEKAVNSIKSIFDPGKEMHLNERSKKVVTEIQSFISDGYIPYVKYIMVNNGLKWNDEGQSHIDNAFKGQRQVNFEHYNHDDILQYINRIQEINASIQLKGLAIREDFNYKSVIIGRVCVTEIFKLLEEYGDTLLEKNIRKHLGTTNVNLGIRSTLTDEENRNNFFFYNNGITMVCENFSYNNLQEKNWIVKASKLQIINGGQTCKTILQTLKDFPNQDFSQVDVLLRLYEVTDDEKVVKAITLATNSQNAVDFRDLKANDDIQILLETDAAGLGYSYKRKKDTQNNTDAIPSSVAAESVFAIWRKKPHLAKYKKSEFFSTFYDEIFNDLNAAQMIIAVLVFRYCDNFRKKISSDENIQAQRPYSQYFIAMLIGLLLQKEFSISLNQLNHINFEKIKNFFEEHKDELYEKAEKYLVESLMSYFRDPLPEVDGRSMAAVFRRFDVVEKYLSRF